MGPRMPKRNAQQDHTTPTLEPKRCHGNHGKPPPKKEPKITNVPPNPSGSAPPQKTRENVERNVPREKFPFFRLLPGFETGTPPKTRFCDHISSRSKQLPPPRGRLGRAGLGWAGLGWAGLGVKVFGFDIYIYINIF